MKPLKLTCLVLLCAGVLVVSNIRHTTTPSDVLSLTGNQIRDLVGRAEHDSDAAFELANFYRFELTDAVSGRIWMQRAAALGNETARNNIKLWMDEHSQNAGKDKAPSTDGLGLMPTGQKR